VTEAAGGTGPGPGPRPGPDVVRDLAPAPHLIDPDEPGWRRAVPGPDQLRGDAALAGALFVGAVLSMVLYRVAGFYDEPAAGWVSALCLAAVTAPLAFRRRAPSVAAAVVVVAVVVIGELRVPEILVMNIALFMALYSVGAWESSRRRALRVRLVVVVVMFGWLFTAIFRSATSTDSEPALDRAGAFSPFVAYMLIQLLTNVLYFAGAWWFGDHAWASARDRARTAWRGRLLQRERLHAEEQAVALERLRLARELHDSVAHHVSVMGVQAAAARTLLSRDPERAAAALEQVEESARDAVDELAGVLGVLRADAGPGLEPRIGAMATPPIGIEPGQGVASLGVDRVGELVEHARAGGMQVDFAVVGEPVAVPPMTSLNVYRIAQEALTNTRKHAGASARADVRVRYLDGALEVEVSDDGSGARRTSTPSAGLGLVGMRERVAAGGGTLTAGPRARGGFLVRARLPLAAELRGASR